MKAAIVLNRIAASIGALRYLEIGVKRSATFRAVTCPTKHGVDPAWPCTFRMTSDQFFATVCKDQYDLAFIDGLHLAEQVTRDLYNVLSRLSPGGVVVLHDCLPRCEAHQQRQHVRGQKAWMGDVWKAFATFRATHPSVVAYALGTFGIVHKPAREVASHPYIESDMHTYAAFTQHKAEWLGMIDMATFLSRFPVKEA
jgi:hypothetical protein